MSKSAWGTPKNCLRFWWQLLLTAIRNYDRQHSALLAASIAYYALVCLAPLAILAVIMLQTWLGSAEQANAYLMQLINAVLPAGADKILSLLGSGLHQPRAIFGGIIGVVALAWASLRLFEAIQWGLTIIWVQQPRRNIVIRKLIAMGTLLGVGVLSAMFLFMMSLSAWLRRVLEQTDAGSELLARAPWHPHYTVALAIFALSLLALFLAYKLLPEGRVSNRGALMAAVSAAVLGQLAGRIFNFIVAGIVHLSIIYGTLTWVIVFLLWSYFGASIILFSAHLGWAYDMQRPRSSGPTEADASF